MFNVSKFNESKSYKYTHPQFTNKWSSMSTSVSLIHVPEKSLCYSQIRENKVFKGWSKNIGKATANPRSLHPTNVHSHFADEYQEFLTIRLCWQSYFETTLELKGFKSLPLMKEKKSSAGANLKWYEPVYIIGTLSISSLAFVKNAPMIWCIIYHNDGVLSPIRISYIKMCNKLDNII